MKNYFAALLATVVLLAGARMAEADGKPNIKAGIEQCVKDYALFPLSLKEELRTFMGVSKERAPALFCQRLVKAVAGGRITFSDINRLQESRATEIWKVIKGR